MLQEFNAKNAQFRILPQYKVKSEGEVVSGSRRRVKWVKSEGEVVSGSSRRAKW